MRTAALAASLLFVACASKEQAEAPAPPPPPPAPTVADFAGVWNTTTNIPGAQPVETQIVVNADGSGHMAAAGRDAIPLSFSISGDSLVAVSAEYESLLRKGVKVTVRTASVRTDGGMSGNVIATYKTPAGDETATGTMTSIKAP